MLLYSDSLTVEDLDAIGERLDIEVIRGEFFGPRRRRVSLKFRLTSEQWRRVNHYGRRVGAVCWHGHFAYLREVFERDPSAEIVSGLIGDIRYHGREEFYALAPLTGEANIGSQCDPLRYRRACKCDAATREANGEMREHERLTDWR